jgi:hypothetical protein
MGKKEYLYRIPVFLVLLSCFIVPVFAEEGSLNAQDGMSFGMPIDGQTQEANLSLCPAGVDVIRMFLAAWEKDDLRAMYDLLDDESRKDYPFEQARFDFRLLEFKPYTISSVRKDGENFEFLLSYGSWKDGDKKMRKMVISGKTFKIIMPTGNSPFKKSADDYF